MFIKKWNVILQHLRRVALGIDGDKKHLHPGLSGDGQLVINRGKVGQRRRTNVWTMGKAEDHQNKFSAQTIEPKRFSVLVRQREVEGLLRIWKFPTVIRLVFGGMMMDQPEPARCEDERHQ
jgi:hypothetical protein